MDNFEFTYSAKQKEEVEKIRDKYLPKQESKMDQLRNLDKNTEKAGTMASIVAGTIGSLILGIGMCFTMVWNTGMGMFVAGIIIGLIGMVIVGFAYPIYQKVTAKERAKVADQIIALSNELAMEN